MYVINYFQFKGGSDHIWYDTIIFNII